MGGGAMSKLGQTTEEAELARAYQNSRDLSAFETDAEPVEVRRNVTISVNVCHPSIRNSPPRRET
jgi:hypothetical protein